MTEDRKKKWKEENKKTWKVRTVFDDFVEDYHCLLNSKLTYGVFLYTILKLFSRVSDEK